jgi:hypothetical protein
MSIPLGTRTSPICSRKGPTVARFCAPSIQAIALCSAGSLVCAFLTLAGPMSAAAQAPASTAGASTANTTSAFDGTYVGVAAENNSHANTLSGGRAHPQGYAGGRSCRDFRAPAKLTITNGLARVRWIDYTLEGQVTPQGILTMTTGYGHRFDGRVDDQHEIKGQVVGYCAYTLTWRKQV